MEDFQSSSGSSYYAEAKRPMLRKPSVVLLGPQRAAVSGVSTHLNQLLGSQLATAAELCHFQVGSEGRTESTAARLLRFALSPLALGVFLLVRRPRIVHLNTSLEPKAYWRDIAYLLVARLLGRKVVYQVHGGALPQDFFRGQPWRTRKLRWVLSLPDVVVLLASVEMTAYREFVPGARLRVIPNAIEVTGLIDRPAERSAAGPLHLAYLGRLVDSKGIFEIVAALKILRERGIDCRLSVAGAGPDAERMRALVDAAGLSDRVAFRGALAGAAKDELWRSADIFVFPTWHREGLPYALLESMAAGAVPVVAPAGAIPDVVQNDVHGVFVPPKDPAALADAVASLHGDRARLARLAAAARARVVEHYTVGRLAHDFQDLYESL